MRPSRQDHEASHTLRGALAFDHAAQAARLKSPRRWADIDGFNAHTGCGWLMLLSTRMFFLKNASAEKLRLGAPFSEEGSCCRGIWFFIQNGSSNPPLDYETPTFPSQAAVA
jgi:hypothetical protein